MFGYGVPPGGKDTQLQSRQRHQYLSQRNKEKGEVGEKIEEVKLREDKG